MWGVEGDRALSVLIPTTLQAGGHQSPETAVREDSQQEACLPLRTEDSWRFPEHQGNLMEATVAKELIL